MFSLTYGLVLYHMARCLRSGFSCRVRRYWQDCRRQELYAQVSDTVPSLVSLRRQPWPFRYDPPWCRVGAGLSYNRLLRRIAAST